MILTDTNDRLRRNFDKNCQAFNERFGTPYVTPVAQRTVDDMTPTERFHNLITPAEREAGYKRFSTLPIATVEVILRQEKIRQQFDDRNDWGRRTIRPSHHELVTA